MGKFYKIYMVIAKQSFTEMSTGSNLQQADALASFMARQPDHQSSRRVQEAVDDLSKSSTGHISAPFVRQPVGPFWKPPQPVQPVEKPVVQETQAKTKPKKRGRGKDEDMTPIQQFTQKQCVKKQTNEQLFKTLLVKIMLSLLETHGVVELSLDEFFSTAFLSLPPDHLRQMMEFLSNPDNVWVFRRILMEIPHLGFTQRDNDIYLWIEKIELFSFFNMAEMMRDYHTFCIEAIVHRQNAAQHIHEQKLREEQEMKRFRYLNEAFIMLLHRLWKTKDMEAFFRELPKLCPEFDSKHTNSSLLKIVVGEFSRTIYNATTRAYHNGEPCGYPLQDFLEYCIKRGVFRMRRVRQHI